nr:DUF3866 family protein [Sanguibacter antarcticus]
MTRRTARVVSLGRRWDGAQELTVELDHTPPDPPPHHTVRALAYPTLVGDPHPGDTVLLNTTALDRGLGTGGYALVIAVLPPPDQHHTTPTTQPDTRPSAGHLVKARYTPHQTMVLGVDEQESPHHHLLRDADTLDNMPVIVADLHSALPAIIAGARHTAHEHGRPTPRITYVMTDGGALPAWFSRTISGLRDAGWLDACITVGQAFGGDLEAVTTHTGLLAAHLITHADITIVTQGPGNLGTGTRWGFSGTTTGETINATSTLNGHPIASLRISGADPRPRHHGISHHSLTAYTRVALRPADIPLPTLATTPTTFTTTDHDPHHLDTLIHHQATPLTTCPAHHTLIPLDATPALAAALEHTPVPLSTMGRGLTQDPAAFLAAALAGTHAATLLS